MGGHGRSWEVYGCYWSSFNGLISPSVHRYNVHGFIEELPQLPRTSAGHACAALPDTGVGPATFVGQWGPLGTSSSVCLSGYSFNQPKVRITCTAVHCTAVQPCGFNMIISEGHGQPIQAVFHANRALDPIYPGPNFCHEKMNNSSVNSHTPTHLLY